MALRAACHTSHHQLTKGAPKTNITSLARGFAFAGSLLLLYTLASGFSLNPSGAAIAASAVRQHSIVGVLGTALCIAALILLLRHKS